MKPFLVVVPKDALRFICHPRPWLAISIVDPVPIGNGKRAELFECSHRLDCLHLTFGDFHNGHFREYTGDLDLRALAMQPWHASCVREFLHNWQGLYETLVISCEAGVSRSPSMALAIAEHFGVDRRTIEPVHRNWEVQPLNPLVYQLTKDAMECRPERQSGLLDGLAAVDGALGERETMEALREQRNGR